MISDANWGNGDVQKNPRADGSKTAENVLPYARCFARNMQIPVELLAVVDVADLTRNISVAEGLFLGTLIER